MKKTILYWLLKTTFVVGLFLVVSAATAFAGNLTVTNTNPAPVVGTNIPDFTVTLDIAASADIVDGGTITFTLPANFPQVATTDANDGKVGLSAITLAGVDVSAYSALTTSANSRTLTVTFADVDSLNGGVEAIVNGDDLVLTFSTSAESGAGASATVSYAGTWSLAANTFDQNAQNTGTYVLTSTTPIVATAQDSAATRATVTLGSAVAGATQTTSVNFTLPIALASGDTVEFTMPAYMYVGGLVETNSAQTFDVLGATFDCVDTAQKIVCTADGAISAGAGAISLIGVTGMYVADATALTDFEVEAQGVAANDIAVDTSVAVPAITIGAVSSASITPRDMTASQYNPHTIAFTTPYIPNLGKIKITYPSGWGLESVNGLNAHTLSGLDGTWTASVSGQVITLTQTGGSATSAGAKSLVLESIKAPVAPGSGGDATILTEIAAGTDIATVGSISTGTVTAGSYTSSWDSSTSSDSEEEDSATEDEASTTEDETDSSTTDEEVTTNEDETDSTTTDEEVTTTEDIVTITTVSGEEISLNDVSDHWATAEITAMVEAGIINGDPDGTFRPDEGLNRAEAAKLLYRVLGLEEPLSPAENPFSDVDADEWYAGYVAELKAMELVAGNPDGTYKPGNSINRAEFLTLAMNVYEYLMESEELEVGENIFSDLSENAWYTEIVLKATALGFVEGSVCGEETCFNATSEITRAEAVTFLNRMFGSMLQEADEEEVVVE
jgi:hypothetical protein